MVRQIRHPANLIGAENHAGIAPVILHIITDVREQDGQLWFGFLSEGRGVVAVAKIFGEVVVEGLEGLASPQVDGGWRS